MKKVGLLSLIIIFGVFSWNSVSAQQLVIEGNGAGSQTSVVIDSGTSLNLNQNNSSTIVTNITSKSNTGNNKVNENTGNATIVTGDSSTSIKVTNIVNTNISSDNCCITPTIKPHPTVVITSTPDPTSGSGTSSDPSSNSSNNSSSPSTSIGGGEVLSLSATSGENDVKDILLISSAFICLGLAATSLLRHSLFLHL